MLVPIPILLLAAAVWPKFGVVKTHVRFAVFHPPAFHSFDHQVRLQVDASDMRAGFVLAPRVQHSLEEGLAREGLQVTPNARTLLQCTLTDTAAFLETQARAESVNVHVGEHSETDKDGKTKQVEDCKVQNVPVTYLVSSGHLAMDVKAKDTQTQALLASAMVEKHYHKESPIAGPPKCNGEAYPVPRSEAHDPFFILGMLADQAVGETLPLASGYDEPREVLLAVDDELKPGNAQAGGGAWQDALDTWTNASMRTKAGGAARQYNMGVAHEVLAANARRDWQLNDASSHLAQSEQLYSQALKIDPNEKYFRDTLGRIQMDRGLLQQQLDQTSQDQPASQNAPPSQPTTPAAAPSRAAQLDGWPADDTALVHDYRIYVRTRLSGQPGRPTEALKQELLAGAGDYEVDSGAAVKVLDSETQRLDAVRKNIEKYREDFQSAASDGVITPDKREMLRRRQQILRLSDEQVRRIESQFKFEEKG